MDATKTPTAERGWRVYGPLGAIVLLVVGMLVLDLVIAHVVTSRTDEMVEDTMRSIDLVHGLREKVVQLAAPDLSAAQLRSLTEQLAADTRAYDPLATYTGEREEWGRLRDALVRLQHDVQTQDRRELSARVAAIGESVARLVAINRRAGDRLAVEIRASQRQEVLIDLAIGAVTIMLIVAVGLARRRAAARERTLVAEHLSLIEERNRELDAFASRAAHDLRSPLSPIRGYADLIIEGQDPPEEMQRMAGRIRVCVDRMARVVENMLELARSGRPLPGRALVREVCAEVLEELAPDLHQAKCSTSLALEAVSLAPDALGQILRNLIGNAIKYRSPERPLEIGIVAETVDGQVVIRVEDNGVGMDTESALHAFEPFFRARRDVAGHGLGLAIVERIVRGAGGSCELSSATDNGTRVMVRLPRASELKQEPGG
jgi:two-component system, OmpR family, sensor kinase